MHGRLRCTRLVVNPRLHDASQDSTANNGGGKGGGGPGEGWALPVDMWTSPHQAGGGGGVDGRERCRCALSGDRTAVISAGGMDVAGAGSRNGAPERRFGVQQGVSGDHLLPWSGLTGPLRAPVSAPHRQDVGPGGAAAAGRGAAEPVWDVRVGDGPASGAPLGNCAAAAGRQQVASVAPIPAWRLDALQFAKIKRANRL